MLFFGGLIISQNFQRDYFDGQIYLRLKNTKQNNLLQKLGTNAVSISKHTILAPFAQKFGIQSVSRPFFAADDCIELQNTYLVKFSKINLVNQFLQELTMETSVELAEKVPYMQLDYTPNDPSYSTQQWYLNKINAALAWNFFHGNSNVAVAVVDNAVQISHTDLLSNIWVNPNEIPSNGIDDDNNGFVDDMQGYDVADNDNNPAPPNTTYDHGTHCAGLVAARTDNNTGIAAIGFNLKIIAVKASSNSGSATAVDAGFAGIVYAVKAGARVISCSWGGTTSAATEQTVINYAWNKKSIVVAAAGNSNVNAPHYPAAYNNCYAVASTTSTDAKSSFSNYGTWVDISAPGSTIYSTLPTNTYGNKSGTSMATPIVAGLCGLMYALKPYATPSDILNCINSSATNINTQNANYIGQLGAGRIDANAAMQCVSGITSAPPIVDFIANKNISCVGSPVQFFDQTYIGATAWSWSFPGGTPSVSTVKNPIITYTSPGSYAVTLSATNPNGTGTISKSAFISVTLPTQLPLQEGFLSAFPPQDWALNDFFLDSVAWMKTNSTGGYGTSTQSAFFDNYNYDSQGRPEDLLTPKYDFSNLSSASLSFDIAYARYDATYSDSLQVLASTDCGQTYTSIYLKGGTTLSTAPDNTTALFVPTNTQWRTETISLNSFIGQPSVLLAFRNRGHYGQGLYIDNININGVASGAPPVSLYSTQQNICSGQSIQFTDQSSNAPNSWNWTVNPSVNVSLNSASSQNPSILFMNAGSYTVTLVSSNGFGSSAPYSQVLSVSTTPTVTVSAPSTSNCQGIATSLTANGASSYTWNNGSTNTSLTVNPPITTTYTVTGVSGVCSDTATITITVKPLPVASISGAGTICAGDTLQLTASGGTTYLWSAGTSPSNSAIVSVSPAVTTQYTVTVTGANGCSKNSTAIVSVNPLPLVQVNSDSICPGTPILLTATGANNYLWSNGASGSTITLSPTVSTTVSVTGTGNGNCTNTATSIITVFPTQNISISQSFDTLFVQPQMGNSYQWSLNGSILPGDTNYYLLALQNGTYILDLIDNNGCVLVDSFIVNNVGLIQHSQDSQIKIFPNPFEESFSIEIAETIDSNIDLEIKDVLGKTCFHTELNTKLNRIKLDSLDKGTYFILMKMKGEIYCRKIIKL